MGAGVTPINVALERGGIVTGNVTGPDGPLQGVTIDGRDTSGNLINFAFSDGSGDYTLPLPAGTYVLYFHPNPSDPYLLKEMYNDHKFLDFNSGDQVTVTEGQTHNIGVAIERGGILSGIVKDPACNPLQGVTVDGRDLSGDLINFTFSGGDGSYTLPLPVGDYKISFHPSSPLVTKWYDCQSSSADADIVRVLEGITSSGIHGRLGECVEVCPVNALSLLVVLL